MAPKFEFIVPTLPVLTLQHPAVDDLAQTMRGIYPHAGALGSMTRMAADQFGELHQDERTVQGWVFGRFCDLPSIDHALTLAGVGAEVPRPAGHTICTTAEKLAEMDAATISSNPQHAAILAAGLYHYIADRVAAISSISAAAIILDAGETLQ